MRFINIYNLKRTLNYLCENLDNHYNINSGGCCYVSYFIANGLDQLNIKYDLTIYDDYKRDETLTCNEILLRSFNSDIIKYNTCHHYCITITEIGGGTINEGNFSSLKKSRIKNLTSNDILWICRNGHWNTKYNHSNDKYVKRAIDLIFYKNMKKIIYPITKIMTCPRCKRICKHILYDYKYTIYKCKNCGNLHI